MMCVFSQHINSSVFMFSANKGTESGLVWCESTTDTVD